MRSKTAEWLARSNQGVQIVTASEIASISAGVWDARWRVSFHDRAPRLDSLPKFRQPWGAARV